MRRLFALWVLGQAVIFSTPALAPFDRPPLYQVIEILDQMPDAEVVEIQRSNLRATYNARLLEENVSAELFKRALP